MPRRINYSRENTGVSGNTLFKFRALPMILLSSIGDEFSKKSGDLFSAVLTKPIKQHVLGRCILNSLSPDTKQNGLHRRPRRKRRSNYRRSEATSLRYNSNGYALEELVYKLEKWALEIRRNSELGMVG